MVPMLLLRMNVLFFAPANASALYIPNCSLVNLATLVVFSD